MCKTGRSQGNVEKAPKSVSPSTILVVPDPIFSYSINSFSYEDSRTQQRTLMTRKQQMKDIFKWNTPLNNLTARV